MFEKYLCIIQEWQIHLLSFYMYSSVKKDLYQVHNVLHVQAHTDRPHMLWGDNEIHVCLWITAAISSRRVLQGLLFFLNPIFLPTHPWGHVISMICEKPSDELSCQVWFWLMYHNWNLICCIYAVVTGLQSKYEIFLVTSNRAWK